MIAEAIAIGQHRVGPGQPVFVVAEIGMNHNGELDLAKRMIEAAAACGADAVKFQSFRTDAFLSNLIPGLDERRQYEIPEAWYPELIAAAAAAGVEFFSTPLDAGSAQALAGLGVPCFKIASCDLTNLPLIEQVAGFGRPVILSTGFATLGEVDRAVEAAQRAFGLPVGLSDHSRDEPSLAALAVGLGAVALEKHFTLDPNLPGYDHAMSETPESLTRIVSEVRKAGAALGDGRLQRNQAELARRQTARRGLYWSGDFAIGDEITADKLIPLRPSHGVEPAALPQLIGRRLQRPVKSGEPIELADLDWA